jgi:hypothetical protein
MIKAKLFTRKGEFVEEFVMPESQIQPEVTIWGTRVFVLREIVAEACSPLVAEYYEVCAWIVEPLQQLRARNASS